MTGVPLDDLEYGDPVQVRFDRFIARGFFTGYNKLTHPDGTIVWVVWIGCLPIPARLIKSIMYATEVQDAESENP